MQVMSNGKVRRSEGEWRDIFSRYERGGLRARVINVNVFLRDLDRVPAKQEELQTVAP